MGGVVDGVVARVEGDCLNEILETESDSAEEPEDIWVIAPVERGDDDCCAASNLRFTLGDGLSSRLDGRDREELRRNAATL